MKKKNILAILTARKKSKSVKKKNLIKINSNPIFLKSIIAAKKAKNIDNVICTTDDPTIKKISTKYKFTIIHRPENLSGDNASHLKTIQHALLEFEKISNKKFDIIVLLLGNVVGINSRILDESINLLKSYDSVVSVSEFSMFNPLRAFLFKNKNFNTFLDSKKIKKFKKSNDKKSAGKIYFCNGNFWIFKRDNLFNKKKQKPPFPWLGLKIRPYIQDTFFEIDAPWQIKNQLDFVKKYKGEIKNRKKLTRFL